MILSVSTLVLPHAPRPTSNQVPYVYGREMSMKRWIEDESTYATRAGTLGEVGRLDGGRKRGEEEGEEDDESGDGRHCS